MDSFDDSDIQEVEFNPGDILFNENEQSYHFFIIQEGQVEVYKTSPVGKRIPLAVVGEGTSIGEFAMIDRRPRSATAQALTTVRAAKVSEAAYQQLIAELPDWAVAVMRSLVERLRHTNDIVRRAGVVDTRVQQEIASAEYDPDTGSVRKDNLLLRADDDSET